MIGVFLSIFFISMLVTRTSIFKGLDNPYATPFLYAHLGGIILLYITGVTFVCARYMSAPWIRRSYLSNELPWYVRVLYWEKLPSILKFTMWLRRIQQALFMYTLRARREPYELEIDFHRKEGTGLFQRFRGLIMVSWPRRYNTNRLSQNYTDDYEDDIPLLSSNEPETGAWGPQASSSSTLLLPDLSEVDAFDYVGEENARVLRKVERVLTTVRPNDANYGIRKALKDGMYAGLWLNRLTKRRTLRDILFDTGFIKGGNY